MPLPTVYIINRATHDFSAAKAFGTLDFLSEGRMNRYETNNIHRLFWTKLRTSAPEDYILITSLNTMNIIASNIMVLLHKRLNLLIHDSKTNSYVERIINYEHLI